MQCENTIRILALVKCLGTSSQGSCDVVDTKNVSLPILGRRLGGRKNNSVRGDCTLGRCAEKTSTYLKGREVSDEFGVE